MILEFSIENWLSFKDKTTFSMLACDDTKTNKDCYVKKGEYKILKSSGIFGANASGKSNMVTILETVVSMLKLSNSVNANDKLNYNPFRFDPEYAGKPSSFEIIMVINDTTYIYGFSFNRMQIINEYLHTYIDDDHEEEIFSRENTTTYHFNEESDVLDQIVKMTNDNRFFLAMASNLNYTKTKPVFNFIISNIGTIILSIGTRGTTIENLLGYANKVYYENEDIKKFALEKIKEADFDIDDFSVEKVIIPEEFVKNIPMAFNTDNYEGYRTVFNHDGILMDISEESMGTVCYFVLLAIIGESFQKDAEDKPKVILIDELDKSLHPIIEEYVIDLFNNPETNINNVQLIFSSHNTNLLNSTYLSPDQIWFMDKTEDHTSDLYRLSDFEDEEKKDIAKKYLAGIFGAIPSVITRLYYDD